MKKILFVIQFILACFLYGQKASINIEVSDTDLKVGQNVTISITSNVGGTIDFQFPKNFQKGYTQMEGMSQEYSNGRSSTIYYKRQNGYFTEKGSYTIGPASVKVDGKLIKSNKIKVKVNKGKKLAPKKNKESPSFKTIKTIYGETNSSKNKVYEGEAFSLNAKVYSIAPFSIRAYTPYSVQGKYDDFELSNKSPLSWVREDIDGEEYYTLELDDRVFFPVKSGSFEVNPFKMDIVEKRLFTLFSDSKNIEVQALPKKNRPLSFKGLVGDFKHHVVLSNTEAKTNEVITLQVSIEGVGNLQHASAPEIVLPKELELYADPVEVRDYQITKNGFKGKITYTFPIKLLKESTSFIAPIEFSYFNSSLDEYKVYHSDTFTINSNGSSRMEIKKENLSDADKILDLGIVQNESDIKKPNVQSGNFKRVLIYSIGFGACGALFLLLFLRKRKINKKNEDSPNTPTLKELKILIQEIDKLPITDQADFVLFKMEDCLSKFCSFLIGTDRIHLSRNELYVLLLQRLNNDEIQELKNFFNRIDLLRYSNDMSEITQKDIKSDFKILTSKLLTIKT